MAGKFPRDILRRVNQLDPGDSSSDLYDAWAEQYDSHLESEFGYISPRVAARALRDEIADPAIEIIDYACGTGLAGAALRDAGFADVDGLDVSRGMLARAARKKVYRHLACVDLCASLPLADERYDAGCCVGSMGAGHIGAEQVPGLLRPLRRGAPFVIVINAMHYSPEGFESAFRQMESDGLWQIRRLEPFNYMTRLDRPGWLLLATRSQA